MNVVGLRSRSSQSELASALGNAYWVFLCCPLTTATRGMVDRAFLARLPRGASLVNVGRGELIVEQDLFEALQSGHLGAVYSDVFSEEPLPPESPWWGFDNVLLSPHIGGLSSGFARRTEDMFLDNLQRWLTGRPLVNVAVPASATA